MTTPRKRRFPQELGLDRSDKLKLWIFGGLFVLVLGAFLGLQIYGASGDNRETVELPSGTTGREPVPASRSRDPVALPVREIDPKWGLEIREGTHEGRSSVKERPFWLVLNYVKNLDEADYLARREAGEIEPVRFEESVRRLVNIPETFRFRHVAVEGRVTDTTIVTDVEANDGEIDGYRSGLLVLQNGELVRLVSPRPWPFVDGASFARPVLVEGIFHKRWGYVSPSGEEREIPLVVVTAVFPGGED